MGQQAPDVKLSFGLPVRNGETRIQRVVDSVLRQTFEDFELVISDNASTDRTPEICRELAAQDPRVRYCPNERDIGLLRNFNRLVGLAQGEYFRWIGIDDWLEPEYAALCVSALDAHPKAIGVTTYQTHWDDEGKRLYVEFSGPRVESPRPEARFARMLWFLQQDYRYLDPIYTMYRREVLASTRLHRIMVCADRPLAAELSLRGPYVHVPRPLAHRRRTRATLESLARKCRPPDHPPLDTSAAHRTRALLAVVREAELTRAQRARCLAAVGVYHLRELRRRTGRRLLRRARETKRGVAGRRAASEGGPGE